jgi:cytochrome c oxidase subunit 2
MSAHLILAIAVPLFVVIFQISKASEYVSVLKGKKRLSGRRIASMVFFIIASDLGLIGAAVHNLLYHKTMLCNLLLQIMARRSIR